MAKGNKIVASANPRGVFQEATANGVLTPGTLCQVDASAGIDADGRYHVEPYSPGADGGRNPVAIVCEGSGLINGATATTAYADNDRVRIYFPIAGEEINVLSGEALAVGDLLVGDNTTGKFNTAAGTESMIPFQALEAAGAINTLTLALAILASSQV